MAKEKVDMDQESTDSRQAFNELWTRVLDLPKKTDVYARLSIEDFIVLKECISNVNGLITQQVTLSFIDWLGKQHLLSLKEVEEEKNKLSNVSAYANGFDVDIDATKTHKHIVGEVKCNLPTSPEKFSVMQKKGIIKDLMYMSKPSYKKGKKKSDLKDTYRFMVLLDYKSETKDVRAAMQNLLEYTKEHESISISHITYKFCDMSEIETYSPTTKLDTDKIYIVYIPLNTI